MIKATPQGIFRSGDGGRSWGAILLPPKGTRNAVVHVLVQSESPGLMYAAGFSAGVLRSLDGGGTWESIANGLPSKDVDALAMHSFRRDTLYVSIRNRGMYRTEDGGRTWHRMDSGPKAGPVLVLAHSPLEGSMNTGWLYAGTPDGPYLSMDCF